MFRADALIVVLAWAFSSAGFSQSRPIEFQRIGTTEGLSSPAVRCVLQDEMGFLWVGTWEGLNRYDGTKFVVFKSDPEDSTALFNDSIVGLYEDASKNLWVATSGGLHCYDRNKGTFARFFRKESGNGETANVIETMSCDGSGNLWFVPGDGGVTYFNVGSKTYARLVHDPHNPRSLSDDKVRTVHAGRSGNIWVATSKGLDVFKPGENSFEHVNSKHPEDTLLTTVNAILEARDGTVWCGLRYAGMARLRPQTGRIDLFRTSSKKQKQIAPSWVSALWEDDSSRIWAGSAYEGFFIFDPQSEKFNQYEYSRDDMKSLNGVSATCFFQDKSGLIWVGTESGLNKHSMRPPIFNNYSFDFHDARYREHNDVWSIHEDTAGILWLGTNGTVHDPGLIRFDRRSGSFRNVKPAKKNRFAPNIYSIREEKTGSLLLGSYGEGLYRLNPRTMGFQDVLNEFPDATGSDTFVRSLFVDNGGMTWVGWRTIGLMRLDPSAQKTTLYRHDSLDQNSLSASGIVSIYEDRERTLWVGTAFGGLNRFDPVTGTFSFFKNRQADKTSINHDVVFGLHEDKHGNLWAGTSEGLNKMNKSAGTFERYSEKDGFVGASVYGILEDNAGNLWLSTEKALMRFNDKLQAEQRVRVFDVTDGVRNAEFNKGAFYRSERGEFFFGGKDGVTGFFPDRIEDNPAKPNVVLTSFKIVGKEAILPERIEVTNSIVVSHSDNVLTFEFAALEFSNPAKNQYAYIMEGFDKDWTRAGTQRSATYTNLDPDEYTFRVKASNSDGVWNEAGTSVSLVVSPPYWMAWWFRSIAIGLLLSVGRMIYFRRVTQLKKANLLREEFSRQLIESQEQERKRIAAELHDSLGQNIMIIKNRALMGLHADQKQEEIRDHLSEISSVATQSLDEARRIAYNLRPYQLDRFGLTEAIRSMLEEVSASSTVKCQGEIDEIEGLFSKEQEINLYRIVQEGVSNIVRHSGARSAQVCIKKKDSTIEIAIRDDGRGVLEGSSTDSKEQRKGFGITGMRERTNILGGLLLLDSAAGRGTTITISIPVKK